MDIRTGDFSGKNQHLSTFDQDCEGVAGRTVLSSHSKQQPRVSFMDKPGIENEIIRNGFMPHIMG
jgi:hypothetical protein